MAKPAQHPFDSIASEMTGWLNNESKWYADALVGGYQAPFAAQANESQKLDYYRRQMYTQNPDGTIDYTKPNATGRDQLMQRVGVDQYSQIAQAVGPGKTPEDITKLEAGSTPSQEYGG